MHIHVLLLLQNIKSNGTETYYSSEYIDQVQNLYATGMEWLIGITSIVVIVFAIFSFFQNRKFEAMVNNKVEMMGKTIVDLTSVLDKSIEKSESSIREQKNEAKADIQFFLKQQLEISDERAKTRIDLLDSELRAKIDSGLEDLRSRVSAAEQKFFELTKEILKSVHHTNRVYFEPHLSKIKTPESGRFRLQD